MKSSPTWQAAHKQLLRDDAQYRKRFRSFIAVKICLACLLLPFYLPYFGYRLFGFPANLCIILSVAALIVFLAVRQFHFQKQSIQRYLENHHSAS